MNDINGDGDGEVTADETAALTADEFATFFQNKVESVHSSTASTPLYDVPYKTTATLDAWTAVTAGVGSRCTLLA